MISAENSSIKYEYTYDNRGNILSAKKYSISVDGHGEKVYTLINGSTETYVYDTVWQDKLASFGSNTYTYDENGIRTSKTVGNITTKFYLDGTNIIAQTDGTTTLYFRYDSNDEIVGFKYDNADYIYIKNMLGDVVGITDLTGNLLVSYAYDPWGVVTSITGTNTALGDLNPFRYRSYYYDAETELYYLQSRYYDPNVCRFINCDNINYMALSFYTVSCNPFAYCKNGPINYVDPMGYAAITAVDASLGVS